MISSNTYRPGFYFLTTFSITIFFWSAGAFVSFRQDLSGLYMFFMLPGLMTPFIISLWMIFSSKDPELKEDFIDRMINLRRMDPHTFPVFFLIMPFTVVTSFLISLLFGEPIWQFRFAEGFSFSFRFVPAMFILVLAAGFEELGWRGYAFDSLRSKYNFLTASLLFSVLWSLWHFPLIFVKHSYQYEILNENIWFAVNFFVSIIPLGIIISWICLKNQKSVIAAIVFHFIVNISQEILDITQITKCIQTLVLVFVVLIIVAKDRELFFAPKQSILMKACN